MSAVATAANAPCVLAHDLGGNAPDDAEVLRCKRCLMPYPQTGHTSCLIEGEPLRDYYGRLSEEHQKLIPITPQNFHRFYRPHGDRIVLKTDDIPKQHPSGLWYPPSVIEALRYRTPCKGTVMAVGPGMLTYKGKRWPIASDAAGLTTPGGLVQPGARVLFQPQGGFEVIKIGTQVFMSLRDDFLLAMIEEE